jgi:hypothetical protein
VPTPDHFGALAAEAVTAPPDPATRRPDAWREGAAHGRSAAGHGCDTCRRSTFRGGDATRPALTGPEAAAELLVPALAHLDRERCVAHCSTPSTG